LQHGDKKQIWEGKLLYGIITFIFTLRLYIVCM